VARYFIGTSGWSFDFWKGSFYPYHTHNYLEYYSNQASVVEIISTFYEIPSISLVQEWDSRTPSDFSFSAKMPKQITHHSQHFNPEMVQLFLDRMNLLSDKLKFILIQMPPNFNKTIPNINFIQQLIDTSKKMTHAQIAVEFRDDSWFTEETYKLLYDCIVVNTPFIHVSLSRQLAMHLDNLAADIYIRLFSSQKDITDEDMGKQRLDRRVEISTLVDILKTFNSRLRDVYILVSNQFSGDATEDAQKIHNEFEHRGLSADGFMSQMSLGDFF